MSSSNAQLIYAAAVITMNDAGEIFSPGYLRVKNNLITEQRPLFFYPNSQQLYAGSVAKGNARLIVPFEFYGKKLYYGLTATGTHDLNPMPFNPRYPMVGLHANALNTILNNGKSNTKQEI